MDICRLMSCIDLTSFALARWGALVIETLMCRVTVISTETCGASVLLQDPSLGSVIPVGDCLALADALRERARLESVSQKEWTWICDRSECIWGSSDSQYLLKVISSTDAATTSPQTSWLVHRPSSPPMTVGFDGPSRADDVAQNLMDRGLIACTATDVHDATKRVPSSIWNEWGMGLLAATAGEG